MSLSALWSLATFVVVVAGCVVGIAVAVRVVVRGVRARHAAPTGLERAGVPDGTDDPKVAFDRAAGKTAWTRISGGL